MALLWGVADKWHLIAGALEFDEDLIDEVDTNNETDEACLEDCVEKWVTRLGPSWQTLSRALTDIGEENLAQRAWNGGEVFNLDSQTQPLTRMRSEVYGSCVSTVCRRLFSGYAAYE